MTLITVAELADRLDAGHRDADLRETDLVVCDVRFFLTEVERGRREYDAAHLPGARFVDLHHELAGGPGGGRHPLPPVAEFTALLGRLGITPATLVVAYDSAGGATAARLWWMLRSIGHGQAAVLDGGYPAWVAAGHAVTAELPTVTPTSYPDAPGWTGIVSADDLAEGAGLGATVIDSRAGERYRGEVEPIDAQAGHIPGAINRFHGDNLGADGTHRPLAEIAARFVGVGEGPIVYCGSGVTACHNLLAMSLVGINQARLYPGSWSEWSNDPARPIATGDEP
jgi:thiosulfate/3-mercaptopyruvate sulfurtransferase